MKVTVIFGMAVMTLHSAISVANGVVAGKKPDPESWKGCTGTDLRCVQRGAYALDCPSPVTYRRMAASEGGEVEWYATSRSGGASVKVEELSAYKVERRANPDGPDNTFIALDTYTAWGVNEIDQCEVAAFIRCHLIERTNGRPQGEADACRQWAAVYGSGNRNDELLGLGTCTLKSGVKAYRTVTGVGDCKWTPPGENREGSIEASSNDSPASDG